jgi:FtsP/CotA-like multicopper oxidase with cupredoxin domain
MPKYIVAFIASPHGTEKDREYHEFETPAQPGTFSFWYHVHSSFPGTTEKLEWTPA